MYIALPRAKRSIANKQDLEKAFDDAHDARGRDGRASEGYSPLLTNNPFLSFLK